MKLVRFPDPILNKVSLEVAAEDLPSISSSIPEMTEIMKAHVGVGLAAVQVGILKCYAILDLTKDTYKEPNSPNVLLVINPIIKTQANLIRVPEGCLSLPLFTEMKERPSEVLISYKDINFDEQEIILKGLLAQCICHELLHMDGKLLIDDLSIMKRDMYRKKLKKRDLL